jgi:hypothetical protein
VPGIERSEAALRSIRAIVAVLTVAGLAACGGGGGPSGPQLTRAQLVAKVNAECQGLAKAAADLTTAQDPNARGTKVAHFLGAAASELRHRIEAIGQLNPPSALAGQVDRFVSLLTRYADQLGSLASSTKSNETYNDLLTRSTSQVNALNTLADQANQVAGNLGFNACAA